MRARAAGESRAPRRKRRPRQGRLRAISELAAAASGCRAEGGVNDPDDFIDCQPGVITIAQPRYFSTAGLIPILWQHAWPQMAAVHFVIYAKLQRRDIRVHLL